MRKVKVAALLAAFALTCAMAPMAYADGDLVATTPVLREGNTPVLDEAGEADDVQVGDAVAFADESGEGVVGVLSRRVALVVQEASAKYGVFTHDDFGGIVRMDTGEASITRVFSAAIDDAGHLEVPTFVEADGEQYRVTHLGCRVGADLEWERKTGVEFMENASSSGVDVGERADGPRRRVKTVTLPEGLRVLGRYAFQGCANLESVEIPDSVEHIGINAFRDCAALEALRLPASLTFVEFISGNNPGNQSPFYGCGIKRVSIPAKLTDFDYNPFVDCVRLSEIEVDEGNPALFAFDGALYARAHRGVGAVGTGEGDDVLANLVAWPMGLGRAEVSLTDTVTAPGGEKLAFGGVAGGAFMGDAGIERLALPAKMEGAGIGEDAFMGCASLEQVSVPEGARAYEIGQRAFMGCASLARIDIPALDTGVGMQAFSGCSSLAEVRIMAGRDGGATDYFVNGGVFFGCSSLRTILCDTRQPVKINPGGGVAGSFWAEARIDAPAVYYAVDFYEDEQAAQADGKTDPLHGARLARGYFEWGTPVAELARGERPDRDGFFHTAGDGFVWALESPYGMAEGLGDACCAWKATALDLSTARVSSAALDWWAARELADPSDALDPQRYAQDADYAREVGEQATWLESRYGVVQDGDVKVVASDGAELERDTDYVVQYSPQITEAGAYLMSIRGRGDYTGKVERWLLARPHVADVRKVAGADASRQERVHVRSLAQGYANTGAPYAVVCDGASTQSTLTACGLAGLGRVPVAPTGMAGRYDDAVAVAVESTADTGSRQALAVGLGSAAVGALSAQGLSVERVERAPSITSDSAVAAAACSKSKRYTALYGYSWGPCALVCPAHLPADESAVAAWAYAMKAPVLFLEADGTLSSASSSCLQRFESVAVPDEETRAAVAGVFPDKAVTVLGDGGQTPGAYSVAVARSLAESGAADLANVAVVDGRDPQSVAAGVTCVGYLGGVVLTASSAADCKEIARFLREHAGSVDMVTTFGAGGLDAALGFDATALFEDACAGDLDDADLQVKAGDTFAAGGCLFECESEGAAGLIACYDAPCAYRVGDHVACAGATYSVTSVASELGLDGAWRLARTTGDVTPAGVSAAARGARLSYASSDTAVVQVTDAGILVAAGEGQAFVEARATDATGAFLASGRIDVQVLDSLAIGGLADLYEKRIGDGPFQLGVTCAVAGATLSYESDDESVCAVDADGAVTVKGPGTALVQVQAASGDSVVGHATATVRVLKREQEVSAACGKVVALDAPEYDDEGALVHAPGTVDMQASSTSGAALSYSSSDESVATVDDRGRVTAAGCGVAVVTASAPETADHEAASCEVAIAVSLSGHEIAGLPEAAEVTSGKTLSLPFAGGAFEYDARSTETGVATAYIAANAAVPAGGNLQVTGVTPGDAFACVIERGARGVVACAAVPVTVVARSGVVRDMADAQVTAYDVRWTGRRVYPSCSVEYAGEVLTWGADYAVQVLDGNGQQVDELVDEGTYTLVVSGTKDYTRDAVYTGATTATFKVSKSAPTDGGASTASSSTPTDGGESTASSSTPLMVSGADAIIAATNLNKATVKAADIKKASDLGATTITLGPKVKKIAKGAFKGTKINTVIVKTKKLKKSSVKGSLKGSKVKTVKVQIGKKKVNKKYVKKYKKIFTKKIAGKKAKVK